ncbi:MAG TPA: hypothetical protein VMU27_03220 [Candidatus Paceibacterota bacterium]|nr:hypothetical protein [Candidatus Paceibacterota bacterium]
MQPWGEARLQRLLTLEGILIVAGIGIDLFIQTLIVGDWLSGAVLFASFCVCCVIYWHRLHMNALFGEVRAAIKHLSLYTAPPKADIPLSLVTERPVIHVSNFPLSKNFYETTLGKIGYTLTAEFPALSFASFGIGHSADIWIKGDGAVQKYRVSFAATSREAVDNFYAAATDLGGKAHESSGARSLHGVDTYAAAVLDPDGYIVEAFFRDSSSTGV